MYVLPMHQVVVLDAYVHKLMQFEWDEEKSNANKAKHGLSFELARFVFDDCYHLSLPDDFPEEERWRTVGLVNGVLILLVVHTLEEENNEEIIRIISARKATRHEREAYENQYKKT